MSLPFGFHESYILPYNPKKSKLVFRVGNREFVTLRTRNFEMFYQTPLG